MVKEAGVASRDAMALKEHFNRHCVSLYGSKARVDGQGEIFIPSWHDGQKRINRITEDDGHVDTAIRMTDHILTDVQGRETDQVQLVLDRSRQLVDLFTKYKLSAIPGDVREALHTETRWLLGTVNLDPDKVILEEKKKMIGWLNKASLGEDSLGRLNQLITLKALFASRSRAYKRQEKLYQSVLPKYANIHESLVFAKSADVDLLDRVKDKLGELTGIVYIRTPSFRDKRIGSTIGVVNTLTWLLGQTKVRPYRPQALKARGYLRTIRQDLKLPVPTLDNYQQLVSQAQEVIVF